MTPITEHDINRFRLDLMDQLKAALPYALKLDTLARGQCDSGWRGTETDDVLSQVRALEQAALVAVDRNAINRAVLEVTLLEAGRVALSDAGR